MTKPKRDTELNRTKIDTVYTREIQSWSFYLKWKTDEKSGFSPEKYDVKVIYNCSNDFLIFREFKNEKDIPKISSVRFAPLEIAQIQIVLKYEDAKASGISFKIDSFLKNKVDEYCEIKNWQLGDVKTKVE